MAGADAVLLDQISTLLAGPESRDDPVQLERTLTDGYAYALSLEGERWRLQREIGMATAAATRGDLASRRRLTDLATRLEAQDGSIAELRLLLARLRRRYSAAAGSSRRYTSPDRTA